ncbi:MAG: glycosyltransferase family 9 protein [Alphaproteobacteria bacterium]|nr:glycosyltransferase family 9 protein [Alphaproteobacteria bacterium]
MRILIIKLAAIGDVIMASSMIPALRSRHPAAHITWLVGSLASPLVAALPGVDEVISIDEKALLRGSLFQRVRTVVGVWGRLRGRRFDLIVTAHPDRRFGLLTLGVRGRQRRALWARPMGGFVPGRHHSHEYVRLVSDRDGPEMLSGEVPVFTPPLPAALAQRLETSAKLVLLAPGGASNTMRDSPMRRWPVTCYRALAEKLIEAGHRVVLIGAPSDIWVREHFQGIDTVDLLGETGLVDLVAVMRRAALVVSHDSMSAHMPRLAGVPVVALFGPTDPGWFAYPDARSRVLWGGAGRPCRPCYDGKEFTPCEEVMCMKSLSVDIVMAAVNDVLASNG